MGICCSIGTDHRRDEADVVGAQTLRFAAAGPGVPGAVEAVGVGDQEMPGVGLGVPVVGTLGLRTGAEAAVQHHHQRGRVGQSLGAVEVEGAGDAARLDDLGGLSDRDRLRARRSQRMPAAAQASAEHGGQDGDEASADGPSATRSHDAIVAAEAQFDK